MMTGAIVGGKSVEQAAKLQSSSATVSTHVYAKDPSPVIIMFSPSDSSLMDHSHKDSRHVVIAASSALSTLVALLFALTTLVDSQHRIRLDRLDSRKPAFYARRDQLARDIWRWVSGLWKGVPEKRTGAEMEGLLR